MIAVVIDGAQSSLPLVQPSTPFSFPPVTSLFAIDIEEITQKAGNYKRFGVFATMVSSAFSKNSESVFVDLLTLSDLEMLKARKAAASTSSANSGNMSVTSRTSAMRGNVGQHKRYLILTYTGEFDRVHYPLPLAFEEVPNAPALQRTIRRLRAKLVEKAELEAAPASDREREMRAIVAQLRQDNTELRHRLRHGSGAAATGGNSRRSVDNNVSSPIDPSAASPAAVAAIAAASSHSNSELVKENQKLRYALDSIKLQLKQQVNLTEALKTQHAKELARLRQRSLGGVSIVDQHSPQEKAREKAEQQEAIVAEYRRKILYLERELRLQRLAKGVPSHSSSHKNSSSSNKGRSTRSQSPIIATTDREQSAQRQRPRPSAGGASPINGSSYYSPSSSLGRRFDPTAYVSSLNRRSQSAPTAARRPSSSASSATGGRYRYDSPGGDSGYSSAGSTRSKQSNRSASARSDRSSSSGSATGKNKKKSSSSTAMKKKTTASAAAVAAVVRTPPPARRSLHRRQEQQQHVPASTAAAAAAMTRRHYREVTVDSAPAAAPRAATAVNHFHGHGPRKTEDGYDDDDRENTANRQWNSMKPAVSLSVAPAISKEVLRQSDASFESVQSLSSTHRSKSKTAAANNAYAARERSRERSSERGAQPAYGTGGSSAVSLGSNIGAANSEVSEIDRRIAALQSYLDKARAGIVTTAGAGETA